MSSPARTPLGPASLVAIGAIITVAFAGSVVVTPLYPLYQNRFGISGITLTLIYAVYVVGNVAALLLFGQLSDQIGRKRVAVPALALAVASAVLFVIADGATFLFLGRTMIGLAVGVASGTGTAWLADEFGPERRATATLAAASANLAGIALGPMLGGLLAQYAPHPLTVPFLVCIAIVLVLAVLVLRVPQTHPGRVNRLSEVRIRPRVGVPRELWGSFAAPGVCGFVAFALGGLYFAVIPGLVRRDLHNTNVATGGFLVFELAALAVVIVLVARGLRPAVAMTTGLVAVLPAVALAVVAQAARSMPVLIVATALAGVVLALGYRGSLQVVNDIAPDDRRAEVVSSYYIACFVGNSVPVIGIGLLTAVTDSLIADVVFAATLAVLALGAMVWQRRQHARPENSYCTNR